MQGVRDLRVQQGNLVSTALPLTTRRNVRVALTSASSNLKMMLRWRSFAIFWSPKWTTLLQFGLHRLVGRQVQQGERRLPELQRLGIEIPIPLRSLEKPDQIDGLGETNKLKVEKANMLYSAVERIATTASNKNIFTRIENPGNSHYWNTTPMQNLIERFGDKRITFHNCCHGGSRDKLTAVWVNESWLDSLEARCDGSHNHQSWKVTMSSKQVHFPTSEEAAYPPVLCQRIVECVKQKAIQFGAIFSSTLKEQLQQPDADAAGRIALGALPRGTKVKPLVAEF